MVSTTTEAKHNHEWCTWIIHVLHVYIFLFMQIHVHVHVCVYIMCVYMYILWPSFLSQHNMYLNGFLYPRGDEDVVIGWVPGLVDNWSMTGHYKMRSDLLSRTCGNQKDKYTCRRTYTYINVDMKHVSVLQYSVFIVKYLHVHVEGP